MELLQPVIQPYAWGSRHGIAGLQGRPVPSPGPEAELWMGAHPSAPSAAAGTTLDAYIAADPDRELGPGCVARFGPRLPGRDRPRPGPRRTELRRRLAQARTAVRPDPVRGPGRPAHPALRGRPPP